MKRNDLIVVNLASDRPGEWIVERPEFITLCANALRQMIWSVGERLHPDLNFELLIAEIEPGSLRIGFLPVLRRGGEMTIPEAVALAADSADLLDRIFGIVIALGVSAGFFALPNPSTAPAEDQLKIAGVTYDNHNTEINIQNFIVVATAGGDREVVLSIPGQPDCQLNAAGLKDWAILGKDSKNKYTGMPEIVTGQLQIIDEGVDIQYPGINRLMLGELSGEYGKFTVAVLWQSQAPPPKIGQIVSIEGELSQTDLLNSGHPLAAVPAAFRKTDAALLVTSQFIKM